MSLNIYDWLVVALYAAVILTVGLFVIKKPKTSEGYFLANRSLKWPFIGASMFASNISAEHLVGLAAGGFAVGMAIGGYEWMAIFCMVPLVVLFLPFYIKNKIYTVPEFLERRFSPGVRSLLAGLMLVTTVLTKVSVSLWAAAVVFHDVFGWSTTATIVAVGLFTALYTMKGGLNAVIYTDAIQSTVLLVAAVILTLIGLDKVGGWSGLQASVDPKFFSMVKPLNDPDVPWLGMFVGIFLAGSFYWSMDQVLVQRAFAAKDLNEGRKGAVFCAFLKILTPFVLVLPGVIARGMDLPIKDANSAYPQLLVNLMPHGLLGLTVAGIAAALMGHLSATFNSIGTMFTRDFYMKFCPDATHERQIWVGRIVVLAVALAGIVWSPLVGLFSNIWEYLQSVSVFLVTPFVGVFFIGVLWKRINVPGVYASVMSGFVIGPLLFVDSKVHFLSFIIPHIDGKTLIYDSWMHRAIAEFVICSLILIIVSLFTAPPSKEHTATTTLCRGALSDETAKPQGFIHDYRLWLALVLAITCTLWYLMR